MKKLFLFLMFTCLSLGFVTHATTLGEANSIEVSSRINSKQVLKQVDGYGCLILFPNNTYEYRLASPEGNLIERGEWWINNGKFYHNSGYMKPFEENYSMSNGIFLWVDFYENRYKIAR